MSRDSKARAELLAALGAVFREQTAATIMFHQAIADRLGMNITDHKCADILARMGPITAGALAERTGLTTGAITGVIDRLEKAGFARRAKDPADRRRVVIEPDLERMQQRISPLFDSMSQAMGRLCARYSVQELELIKDFAARCCLMADEETHKLRQDAAAEVAAPKAKAAKRS